jgi:DMSO/TMAO reductase YedYZ molybdopterin-dependent catalytic subunit
MEQHRPAPLSALGERPTPPALHFLRSHFPNPVVGQDWALDVTGAVERPRSFTLHDLCGFEQRSQLVVLECAGHRRTDFGPPVEGLPWGAGAVSQATWSGPSLARVLEQAGPAPEAIQVVFSGADGDGAFARAISLDKARDEATMLALAIDAQEIPVELGGPLRAIVPGHYAVDSVKWLRRIEVVVEPFRGHFQSEDYCLFDADGVPDGTELNELPITSLVTATERTRIAGVAWGGEIDRVDVQVDDDPWVEATLGEALGRYAFTPWELAVDLAPGSHTAAARATDRAGNTQPERPLWNARGYANSSVHRVAFDLD